MLTYPDHSQFLVGKLRAVSQIDLDATLRVLIEDLGIFPLCLGHLILGGRGGAGRITLREIARKHGRLQANASGIPGGCVERLQGGHTMERRATIDAGAPKPGIPRSAVASASDSREFGRTVLRASVFLMNLHIMPRRFLANGHGETTT